MQRRSFSLDEIEPEAKSFRAFDNDINHNFSSRWILAQPDAFWDRNSGQRQLATP